MPLLRRIPNLCVLSIGITLTSLASAAETTFSLYKSTDHGNSWSQAGRGLPSNSRINALSATGRLALAGTDRGIFLSHDAGENWHPLLNDVGTDSRILCFTAQPGRIFTGTHKRGVLLSDDEGITWKTANTGLTDLHVRSLLTVGTNLYAGTESKGVFVSNNEGASWSRLHKGLPDTSQVFDLAALDGTVFAGLYSQGLYRWDTERTLWVKTGKVSPLELATTGNTLVVGHNPGGIFISTNLGSSWMNGNTGLPNNAPVWTLAADEERIFVGTSGKVGFGLDNIGLFVSIDKGKSWTRSDTGLPPGSASISIAINKRFVLAGISSQR